MSAPYAAPSWRCVPDAADLPAMSPVARGVADPFAPGTKISPS